MEPKQYVRDINADKDKNYLDDLKKEVNLKKGSVDKNGAAKNNTKPTVPDNHVTDLQTDLNNLGIIIGNREQGGSFTAGEPLETDGIFGKQTARAVAWFQHIARRLRIRDVNGKLEYAQKTMESTLDYVVGEKTKKEIKLWKEKGYKNPYEIIYAVPLIQQTEGDCFTISAQMLLKYHGIKATREEIADKMAADETEPPYLPRRDLILKYGPTKEEEERCAKSWGFGIKAGGNYPLDEWREMLKSNGPLLVRWGWINLDRPEDPQALHAVLISGLSTDKGDDSYVLQNNPWGQYEEFPFKDFRALLEGAISDADADTVNVYYYKGPGSSDAVTDPAPESS